MRTIHAPVFRERVLHHALMAVVGPTLDRALVFDSYACRVGKGTLAAGRRAREHARRYRWCVKADVRRYFDSIDHEILKARVRRHLLGDQVLDLIDQIVDAYQTTPGKGLPIGALTSQYFANLYLSPLDRYLLESPDVRGMIRYMDDVVWWCDSGYAARATRARAVDFAASELRLEIKQPVRVAPSRHGVAVCGFRVLPDRLLLTRRRKRRYVLGRQRWERAYIEGRIDVDQLQRGYASVLGITAHVAAIGFRRADLRRRPSLEV